MKNPGNAIEFRRVVVDEILNLRAIVLRKNMPGVSAGFPEDKLPTRLPGRERGHGN